MCHSRNGAFMGAFSRRFMRLDASSQIEDPFDRGGDLQGKFDDRHSAMIYIDHANRSCNRPETRVSDRFPRGEHVKPGLQVLARQKPRKSGFFKRVGNAGHSDTDCESNFPNLPTKRYGTSIETRNLSCFSFPLHRLAMVERQFWARLGQCLHCRSRRSRWG